MNSSQEMIGRISEVRKNSFIISSEGHEFHATLRGRFYTEDAGGFPVVGDYVRFVPGGDDTAVIESVCERKNILQRPDQAKTGVMQYMVANVDHVFIVTSLNEDYSYNRIARYASVAIQGGAQPVAILTKCDLCSNTGRYIREVESISDRIRVHAVSAIYGIGLDELKEYFMPGTTICLMGSSGAGKSTLINAITGKEVMKTSEVRESDSTGRHTTTHRQLIDIGNGVSVIDTPGMREIGMANMQEGIDDTFSDITELESKCRFSNCRHDTEPGCAIKAAIESGELSEERYMLYKNLGAENTRNYAMKKEISKWSKERKKFNDRNNIY
ncbi:MAG: ribosome small subunit-dependent GTPase A [Lachnospiraceae bacterium]|nr:ribosome small subunit-dependent GTPase A [Lachnospiraceae bacterium]